MFLYFHYLLVDTMYDISIEFKIGEVKQEFIKLRMQFKVRIQSKIFINRV